jgi:Transglycosylase SLT domain
VRLLIILYLASPVVIATAAADERTTLWEPGTLSGQKHAGRHGTKDVEMTAAMPLDRVATAVEGVESSHGKDTGMWRQDFSAPQGPMQVGAAAAIDVGGGDRLDLAQNRAIGRAYLAQLYERYRNWPDAIAAYNWCIGKMDGWIKIGRPPDRFLVGVTFYLRRVLHDSGFCNGTAPNGLQQSPRTADRSDVRDAARDIPRHMHRSP